MTDNEMIEAFDILSKMDFFGGQRAGRELWGEKPVEIQDEDIKNFSADIAYLKDFINRQKETIEQLQTALFKCGEEVTRLSDRSHKCIYLSDDETTEYCVDGPCPKFKTEAQIRAEAVKEFAEMLTDAAYLSQLDSFNYAWLISQEDIDNLVKEFTEGG